MTGRTFGHLFAGIDGFGRGLAAHGHTTAWTVELDDHCDRVLAARQPGVERLRDVREVTGPPAVDGITGGFPCQDLSDAGLGAGLSGARSGLYAELVRIVGEAGPAVVIVENVPALLRRGFELLARDLVELGYRLEWDCMPAMAVGAPHRRDRVWIVAHRHPEPVVFGQPAELFPRPPADTGPSRWQKWPRAGWVDGDPTHVTALEPLATGKREALFPTPMAADGHRGSKQGPRYYAGGGDNPTLLGAASRFPLWPTPKASPSGPDYARAGRERSGGDDLATAVARRDRGRGGLNPEWVEWLMGYPLGWTDPDTPNDELVEHPWQHGEPPGVPRMTEQQPLRKERLTALGNSLVPQIPAWLGGRLAPLFP